VDQTINPGDFWKTLGQRAIGATIVTVDGAEGPAGFLGLSATHISANPPMLLASVDKRTSALRDIQERKHFAVNFLPKGAEAIADAFGGKSDLKGADRFSLGEWTTLQTGAPIHAGALGAFDCVLEETIERDSVVIVIGRVVATRTADGEPLIMFRGAYL